MGRGTVMQERDFEDRPYTPDEERVAKYIVELTGIGAGDDPIGFLISSHELLSRANRLRCTVAELVTRTEHEVPSP